MATQFILSDGTNGVRIKRSRLDLDVRDLTQMITAAPGIAIHQLTDDDLAHDIATLQTFVVPSDLQDRLWETVLPRLVAHETVEDEDGLETLSTLSFLLGCVDPEFDTQLEMVAEIARDQLATIAGAGQPPDTVSTGTVSDHCRVAWINLDETPQSASIEVEVGQGQEVARLATVEIDCCGGIIWPAPAVHVRSVQTRGTTEPRARSRLVVSAHHSDRTVSQTV